MNEIFLYSLKLKTFTEQNTEDYCLLNNIDLDNITELYLINNRLTDISGIKLFKNLKGLCLAYNRLINISVLKDLIKLEILDIRNLRLKSDQIEYIKSLKNLKELWYYNGFKDMSVLDKLNKKINLF